MNNSDYSKLPATTFRERAAEMRKAVEAGLKSGLVKRPAPPTEQEKAAAAEAEEAARQATLAKRRAAAARATAAKAEKQRAESEASRGRTSDLSASRYYSGGSQ